jgi:Ca2+-binding EF-hand superfamily protein
MKTNRVLAWMIAAVFTIAMIAAVRTASGQKASTDPAVKQWLAAMDKDNDGTVSKKEFLAYMEAQFDKVDADHDGTLDANELAQLRKNLALAPGR